jgi:sirohydrochlorin ferrochelatase
MTTGVIIVDHGSRSADSNALLIELAEQFARRFTGRYAIVEPAHMELADPTIGHAFARCIWRGADRVVVCPFFLGPGKHWQSDIPRLVEEAAATFPGVPHRVAAPLGIDDLMLRLVDKRIGQTLERMGSDALERI